MIEQGLAQIYTCHDMRAVTGETIRPGGLKITERAVDFCQLAPGLRLLDVGCGTGESVAFLIDKYNIDAIGIDPSDTMLKLGRESNRKRPIFYGQAENIPYTDRSMGALLTECCFSHFVDIDKALQEFYRVIVSDGWLIISDMYTKQKLSSTIEPNDNSFNNFFGKDTVVKYLERHGFEIILWEDRTNELKQLTINIIMRYGTLENFWKKIDCNCNNCFTAKPMNAKLGYYLLVARKKIG
ncbi:DVU_1556 family methyltransferase [Acetobacterium carbinolicum]|uniref:DVU_1556 family methyltransferase n=1 Tax=Acetobacterium carbinolicum TaxID=52690 RepID=UPI0039BF6BB0